MEVFSILGVAFCYLKLFYIFLWSFYKVHNGMMTVGRILLM